jgi:glucose-1-phosphate adenylyltransferase
VTIGERTGIPKGVRIGKNTMVCGVTTAEDYKDGILDSGRTLDKAGDQV